MSDADATVGRWTWDLGAAAPAVAAALARADSDDLVRRLWRGDASLWTHSDEDRWLGWMHVLDEAAASAPTLARVAAAIAGAGFRHVVLLGMGGSSLCPEVLSRTFPPTAGFPALLVLDSTDPRQVRNLERRLDLAHTLFVVSSKSGTTTETNAFFDYFFARLCDAVGATTAPSHFVAITDPGTKLQEQATRLRFRHVFPGVAAVGGRYSALSNFGLVPAACMGVDVADFVACAARMAAACGPAHPPAANPGVALGIALGTLARAGRDKLSLVLSPAIASLGAWLEQLVAESTGKNGTGLVPVDGEPLGPPSVYGDDRVFVATHLAGDRTDDDALRALAAAGHPVLRITLGDKLDLGQEFFRWEIATAVAGSVLGIHPFDQPDVEASKVATRALTAAYEKTGRLPADTALVEADDLSLFAAPAYAESLRTAAAAPTPAAFLAAHLQRLRPGDYFALLAYLEMNEPNHHELQELRRCVRNAHRVATTLGYGPRFLHSTGQLHKGGPASGVFLQITSTSDTTVEIPGRAYDFGLLQRFQAGGDLAVLGARERRALRAHLHGDPTVALARLRQLVYAVTPARTSDSPPRRPST